jgi:hypothetical protein
MLYGFDLDGTLIDSRDAVYQAYLDVGAHPPPDFFTKPWRSWMRNEAAHTAKNLRYIELIKQGAVKALPLSEVYKGLHQCDRVILTGASRVATSEVIMRVLDDWPKILLCEMTIAMKIDWMNDNERGIIFEDQLAHAHKMKQETQWTICHAL